jgi:hypothetical protein
MAADEFLVRHDLSHYSLEKTLGYSTAFMGILNQGGEIKDFEDRIKRKSMLLSDQAVWAENMANLFLMENAQGRLEDFNLVLTTSFNPMGTGARCPQLSTGQLDEVRILFARLLEDWQVLPPGQTLVLEF